VLVFFLTVERRLSHKKKKGQGRKLIAAAAIMWITTALVGWQRPMCSTHTGTLFTNMRINVNTADADTLCLLPGIGPGLSNRIILWRKHMGPYAGIDELQDISGIGPAILERIRHFLVCAPPAKN